MCPCCYIPSSPKYMLTSEIVDLIVMSKSHLLMLSPHLLTIPRTTRDAKSGQSLSCRTLVTFLKGTNYRNAIEFPLTVAFI